MFSPDVCSINAEGNCTKRIKTLYTHNHTHSKFLSAILLCYCWSEEGTDCGCGVTNLRWTWSGFCAWMATVFLVKNNGCINIHCGVTAVVLSALSQHFGSLQQVLLLTGRRLNCFCKLSNSVIIKRHLTELASSSQEGNCHNSQWNTQAVTIHYNKQASWTSH